MIKLFNIFILSLLLLFFVRSANAGDDPIVGKKLTEVLKSSESVDSDITLSVFVGSNKPMKISNQDISVQNGFLVIKKGDEASMFIALDKIIAIQTGMRIRGSNGVETKTITINIFI